jgi:hypothetical protein
LKPENSIRDKNGAMLFVEGKRVETQRNSCELPELTFEFRFVHANEDISTKHTKKGRLRDERGKRFHFSMECLIRTPSCRYAPSLAFFLDA